MVRKNFPSHFFAVANQMMNKITFLLIKLAIFSELVNHCLAHADNLLQIFPLKKLNLNVYLLHNF